MYRDYEIGERTRISAATGTDQVLLHMTMVEYGPLAVLIFSAEKQTSERILDLGTTPIMQ